MASLAYGHHSLQLWAPDPRQASSPDLILAPNPAVTPRCPHTQGLLRHIGSKMMDDACLGLFGGCFPLKRNVTCASSHLKPICFHTHGSTFAVLFPVLSPLSDLLLTLPPPAPALTSHSSPDPQYFFFTYGGAAKGVVIFGTFLSQWT